MMNTHFTQRERIFFYFAVGAVIVCIVYAGIYRSFWKRLDGVKQEIRLSENELSQKTILLEKIKSQIGHGEDLEAYRQKESDGGVRSKMLAALQDLSSRVNVRIADVKPASVRVEKGYKEFPVSMVLEGEFVDIMHFLYSAESRDYNFHVEEFRFSRHYSARSDLRCQVVLSRAFLPEKF